MAYTTVPQVLSPIKRGLAGKRVLLFVKERRLRFYERVYRNFPHVVVRAASPDFADHLARARGLIASPSRGVVTQAIAAGKPVYLFCPRGHLEQEYNLRFYLRNFAGVSSPRTRRYIRMLRGSNRTAKLTESYRGRLLTLQEWDASIDQLDLEEQARRLSTWLSRTDEEIKARLLPLLTEAQAERHAETAAAEEELLAALNDTSVEEEVAATEEEEEEDDDDDEEEVVPHDKVDESTERGESGAVLADA